MSEGQGELALLLLIIVVGIGLAGVWRAIVYFRRETVKRAHWILDAKSEDVAIIDHTLRELRHIKTPEGQGLYHALLNYRGDVRLRTGR